MRRYQATTVSGSSTHSRRLLTVWLGGLAGLMLLGSCNSPPPAAQDDLCAIFAERPNWYRSAYRAERKWGTPVAVTMAFVQRESSFRANAKPPRKRVFWVIPWRRPSSAYGYAQATNETWQDYLRLRGGWFRNRSDFHDAVDFIGWYNHLSRQQLGLSADDAYSLYLAYYHGRGGFKRGVYKRDPNSKAYAAKVAARAARYAQQQRRSCAKPPSRFPWR